MDIYQITFAVLVITSCWLAWIQHRKSELQSPPSSKEDSELEEQGLLEGPQVNYSSRPDPAHFRKIFIPVYLLVMGSDWLQGAYVYTLYKDEKNLAESVVAMLFTCGFLAAAISAVSTGALADKYGRRLACLVFCLLYAVSCLTKIWDDLIILFIGRLLGGVSTTLMYSVFESWMVTEYYARGLEKSSMSLSALFAVMTTLNSIVAIISGVLGESLVAATGTKVSPFMAAVVCLGLAAWLMIRDWVSPFIPSHCVFKLLISPE
jgi:MFS family permease